MEFIFENMKNAHAQTHTREKKTNKILKLCEWMRRMCNYVV